jgi:hypothetical protein
MTDPVVMCPPTILRDKRARNWTSASMGDSGCGRGRSVVRLPGLPAAQAGLLELRLPYGESLGRVPAGGVPRGAVLQGIVQPDRVVRLDPLRDERQGRRVVGGLLPLSALRPEGAVVALQTPVGLEVVGPGLDVPQTLGLAGQEEVPAGGRSRGGDAPNVPWGPPCEGFLSRISALLPRVQDIQGSTRSRRSSCANCPTVLRSSRIVQACGYAGRKCKFCTSVETSCFSPDDTNSLIFMGKLV